MACICDKKNDMDYRIKNWKVVTYMANYSAFNGYHRTHSNYSAIVCQVCNMPWRTKANYVQYLKHTT